MDRRRPLLAGLGAAMAVALLAVGGVSQVWRADPSGASPSFAAFPVSQVSVGDVTGIGPDGDLVPLPLRIGGRTVPLDTPGPGFRHSWPGISAEARFDGSSVVAAFDDDANRYRVILDGSLAHIVERPGRQSIRFDGLQPGPHHIRVEKNSESATGDGAFLGVFAAPGAALDPPSHRNLQFEIIGDSDTVGFGVRSSTRDCDADEVHRLTDTSLTYGPLIARQFDAAYQIIARSGIGLVRNLDGTDPGMTMLDLYPDALFDDPAPWTGPDWSPDVVVIALGSNDFTGDIRPGEAWASEQELQAGFETGYLDFLSVLRQKYPDAYLLIVSMEGFGRTHDRALEHVFDRVRDMGERRVGLLELPKLARTACLWHPSRADHRAMADALAAYLDRHVDLAR